VIRRLGHAQRQLGSYQAERRGLLEAAPERGDGLVLPPFRDQTFGQELNERRGTVVLEQPRPILGRLAKPARAPPLCARQNGQGWHQAIPPGCLAVFAGARDRRQTLIRGLGKPAVFGEPGVAEQLHIGLVGATEGAPGIVERAFEQLLRQYHRIEFQCVADFEVKLRRALQERSAFAFLVNLLQRLWQIVQDGLQQPFGLGRQDERQRLVERVQNLLSPTADRAPGDELPRTKHLSKRLPEHLGMLGWRRGCRARGEIQAPHQRRVVLGEVEQHVRQSVDAKAEEMAAEPDARIRQVVAVGVDRKCDRDEVLTPRAAVERRTAACAGEIRSAAIQANPVGLLPSNLGDDLVGIRLDERHGAVGVVRFPAGKRAFARQLTQSVS